MHQAIAKEKLINDKLKKNIPLPPYDITRYHGATKSKRHNNKCITACPRNVSARSPSPFIRINTWSNNLANKSRVKTEDDICKTSTESSILSVCGKHNDDESSHCTCDSESQLNEELCNCLVEQSETDTQASYSSTNNCMKEIYKFTDTSDTKLVDSYEKLIDSLKSGEYTSVYNLDLFEPHPREIRQINGKNSPPTGYDISLVLPQCVCLINHEDDNVEEKKSADTIHDTKSETMSNLICVPSIAEMSWDILQSGMVEKIPEKYTTNLFLEEEDETICAQRTAFQEDCKITNCRTNHCLHEEFLQKLDKSFTLM